MSIQECCKLGWGTIFAATSVCLLAITAIAIAVIFAPPFFATALLGGSATYVAVGCGAGTLISLLLATLLLKDNSSANEQKPLTYAEMRAVEHQFNAFDGSIPKRNNRNQRKSDKWL